ncbi:MAG TPA: OsmC family protein [Gaiellales bacterium]|nr:OsmC family protein [Gaiellales bacterium]
MDLRSLQEPLKQGYRDDPGSGLITLRATGATGDTPVSCSVDLGRAIQEAQAHAGVGGQGTGACSGDLLLGALVACAQITCQMVAAAMGLEVRSIGVAAEGDLDLRGTLGIDRDAPVGFTAIRLVFDIDAPGATEDELASLRRKTERYCVVMQTLTSPPQVMTSWSGE